MQGIPFPFLKRLHYLLAQQLQIHKFESPDQHQLVFPSSENGLSINGAKCYRLHIELGRLEKALNE